MNPFNRSPGQGRQNDIEAGRSGDDEENSSDPFNITGTKHVSVERLKRWRVSLLYCYYCVCSIAAFVCFGDGLQISFEFGELVKYRMQAQFLSRKYF